MEDMVGGVGHADDAGSGSRFGGGGQMGGNDRGGWLSIVDIKLRLRVHVSQGSVDCHLQLFRFEIGEACCFSITAPAPFVVIGQLGVAVFLRLSRKRRRASHLHTVMCHPPRRSMEGVLASIEHKEVASIVVVHCKRPHGSEATRVEDGTNLGQRH